MKTITLARVFPEPTIGILLDEGPFGVTLELPWRDNARNISCIPEGQYVCQYIENVSLSSGRTVRKGYRVLDVPNRSGILIHCGNMEDDTEGCILVGSSVNFHDGVGVYNSRFMMGVLIERAGTEQFNLHIKNGAM